MLRHRPVNVHLVARTPNPKIDDLESHLLAPKTFLLVWTGRRAQRHETVALNLEESCGGGGGGLGGGGIEKFVGILLGLRSGEPTEQKQKEFLFSPSTLLVPWVDLFVWVDREQKEKA